MDDNHSPLNFLQEPSAVIHAKSQVLFPGKNPFTSDSYSTRRSGTFLSLTLLSCLLFREQSSRLVLGILKKAAEYIARSVCVLEILTKITPCLSTRSSSAAPFLFNPASWFCHVSLVFSQESVKKLGRYNPQAPTGQSVFHLKPGVDGPLSIPAAYPEEKAQADANPRMLPPVSRAYYRTSGTPESVLRVYSFAAWPKIIPANGGSHRPQPILFGLPRHARNLFLSSGSSFPLKSSCLYLSL